MAYNYPIYRAPSVPKLNRTNISSPLKRNIGASGLQINKSRFSFKNQSLGVENLTSENKEQSRLTLDVIGSSLVETNRVLVEIQNQLAIDFSTRIAEDKRQIGELKKQKFRKAAANKEAALESIQGIGKGLFKQVDKVLTPAKSLFEKIIEFFKTILTGLVVNTALNWLSKKENQEKVKAFFQFLADHWKWIVGTLVAGKLLGGLLGVIGVVKKIKGVIDLLRGKGKLPGGGVGGGDPCKPLLQCMGNPAFSSAFVNSSITAFLANKAFNDRIKDIVNGKIPTLPRLTPQQQFAQSRQGVPAGGYSAKNVRQVQEKFVNYNDINKLRAALGIAALPVAVAIPGPADEVIIGSTILSAFAKGFTSKQIEQIAFRTLSKEAFNQFIKKLQQTQPAVARSVGGVIPTLPIQKKKCNSCSLGFSQGGSVGGSGSGTVDSVPAMLAPGEYVIRTAASKLFRPLLSDINENAGRLWNYFREAVTKLLEVTSLQQSNSERFSTILEDLNNTFKQKKQKESLKKIATGDLTGGGKGGGFGRPLFEKAGEFIGNQQGKSTGIPGGGWVGGQVGRQKGGQMYDNIIQKIPTVNTLPFPTRLSSTQQIPRLSSSNSSPVIIPINLPTKKAAMPKINLPQAPASYVPSIAASNASNPYMMLTPSLYGIFV